MKPLNKSIVCCSLINRDTRFRSKIWDWCLCQKFLKRAPSSAVSLPWCATGYVFSSCHCSGTSHYFVIANANTQRVTEALFPLHWKHGARQNTEQECFSTQWTSKRLCKLAVFSHLCCCLPSSVAVSGFLWHCHLLRIPLFFL